MTMRETFYRATARALEDDDRVAAVFAAIGVGEMPRHPRLYDVGIREQLMIGVAAGLALEGYRVVAHSYTPFLIERPYEQLKLDLGHNDVGAVLVSTGASYDAARAGRTHQAPEDVALISTLPGWTIEVPGHPDEFENAFAQALAGDGRVYMRLSEECNDAPTNGSRINVLRRGSAGALFVLAVGPTLSPVLAATADLDVTVAYLSRVRPFDADGLRAAVTGKDLALVEPYLAGTSSSEISRALSDRPHRLLSLGVQDVELRRYGTREDHRRAHGLDADDIHRSLTAFAMAA